MNNACISKTGVSQVWKALGFKMIQLVQEQCCNKAMIDVQTQRPGSGSCFRDVWPAVLVTCKHLCPFSMRSFSVPCLYVLPHIFFPMLLPAKSFTEVWNLNEICITTPDGFSLLSFFLKRNCSRQVMVHYIKVNSEELPEIVNVVSHER